MLPSTKPLVTAPPAFCLWKPSTAPLPAAPLLLNIWNPAANCVVAYMVKLLLLFCPMMVLPNELKLLP